MDSTQATDHGFDKQAMLDILNDAYRRLSENGKDVFGILSVMDREHGRNDDPRNLPGFGMRLPLVADRHKFSLYDLVRGIDECDRHCLIRVAHRSHDTIDIRWVADFHDYDPIASTARRTTLADQLNTFPGN
ncbi:MAG: hypothetical protein H6826_14420 [Planctomycetes bacterium]|nr:hypothetical protein [Planctomycetota bacterium]